MVKVRYIICSGKWGAYFYDIEKKRDIPLYIVRDKLNKYNELKEAKNKK